jgi:hypothetical protein
MVNTWRDKLDTDVNADGYSVELGLRQFRRDRLALYTARLARLLTSRWDQPLLRVRAHSHRGACMDIVRGIQVWNGMWAASRCNRE